jgi:hypothetical protein
MYITIDIYLHIYSCIDICMYRGAAVRTKNGVSTAAEFADLRHYIELNDDHGKGEGTHLIHIRSP